MFSIFILIYIVYYIIILLVLINLFSTIFKIFFFEMQEGQQGQNSLKIAKKLAGETLRLPLQAYLNRGGVGQQAIPHSTPLPFVP